MPSYPNEPHTLALAIQTFTPAGDLPDGVADKMIAAAEPFSPITKLVLSFEALSAHVETLEDVEAIKILAGAAELITLHNFGGKQAEALGVRDAARARLEALV